MNKKMKNNGAKNVWYQAIRFLKISKVNNTRSTIVFSFPVGFLYSVSIWLREINQNKWCAIITDAYDQHLSAMF